MHLRTIISCVITASITLILVLSVRNMVSNAPRSVGFSGVTHVFKKIQVGKGKVFKGIQNRNRDPVGPPESFLPNQRDERGFISTLSPEDVSCSLSHNQSSPITGEQDNQPLGNVTLMNHINKRFELVSLVAPTCAHSSTSTASVLKKSGHLGNSVIVSAIADGIRSEMAPRSRPPSVNGRYFGCRMAILRLKSVSVYLLLWVSTTLPLELSVFNFDILTENAKERKEVVNSLLVVNPRVSLKGSQH